MEDSPIIDSPAENRTNMVFIVLSVLAIVVAILACIVATRAKSSVDSLETKGDNSAQIAEIVEKAVADRLVSVSSEMSKIKGEINGINSKITQADNNLRTGQTLAAAEVTQLKTRLAALESRRPQPQPQQPQVVNNDRPRTPNQPNNNGNRDGTGAVIITPPHPQTADGFYVVKSGDTLSSIARDLKIPYSELATANPKYAADPKKLGVGAKLRLPKRQPAPAQPAGARPQQRAAR